LSLPARGQRPRRADKRPPARTGALSRREGELWVAAARSRGALLGVKLASRAAARRGPPVNSIANGALPSGTSGGGIERRMEGMRTTDGVAALVAGSATPRLNGPPFSER